MIWRSWDSSSGWKTIDLVHPVEELGAEVLAQLEPHALGNLVERAGPLSAASMSAARADVAGHDDDRVLEVDRPALPVGQASVVEHLQQDVEDVRVRPSRSRRRGPPGRAGAGPPRSAGRPRRSRRTRAAPRPAARSWLLHVLAHVDADHRVLVVEQELGQRPGQLGLADAGRAEEDEGADRPVRVLQPGPGAADRVGDRDAPPRPGRRPARAAAPPCGAASPSRLPSGG